MQIVQCEKTNQRSYPSISPLILGAAQGVSLKKRYLCFLKSLHFLRFVGISDCPLWIIFQRNVVFRPRSIVGGVLKLPKERVKATPDYYWSIGRNFYKRIITGSIFFLSLSNQCTWWGGTSCCRSPSAIFPPCELRSPQTGDFSIRSCQIVSRTNQTPCESIVLEIGD